MVKDRGVCGVCMDGIGTGILMFLCTLLNKILTC